MSIEEILANFQRQKGVLGTIVMTKNEDIIKSTFNRADTGNYACLIGAFVRRAEKCEIAGLAGGKALDLIRIRSFRKDLIIFPGEKFILLVVKDTGTV